MASRPEAAIQIRINEVAQLFNSLDPSPFHERDIDRDAEEYIVGWAQELPVDAPLAIVVHLPEAERGKAVERGLATSVANYFAYRAEMSGRQLNELFREGHRALGVGMVLLIACLVASQAAHALLGETTFGRVVSESLLILGWVANWRPLEIYLYAWWPIARRRALYRRLAAARLELAGR